MWTARAVRCLRLAHAQRASPSLLAAHLSTTIDTTIDTIPQNERNTSVSAVEFAEFVRKCGLSKKRLHQQLYPLENGRRAPAGEFPIAVAVSGGADSMALLLLLREYLQKSRVKTPLLAVTVDHQLRAESSREALEVAKICAKRGGITHVTKVCEWQTEEDEASGRGAGVKDPLRLVKPRESKMEEQARQYRYSLLRQVCEEHRVRCLFVAHNLGDQLETTLFRLGRASGINGLAGIAKQVPFLSLDESTREARDSQSEEVVTLVRPLLSVTKDQLIATCNRFQQTWMHDPSNDDLVYDRVRIREELKRVEREHGPDVLDLFARFQQTAEKAKKEFSRIERVMLQKYTVTWEPDSVVIRMAVFHDPKMFDELLYRLLSIIILQVGNKEAPPRLASVARLAADIHRLETGKQITLGGCRIKKAAKGRRLEFKPERKSR
ncbi:tRNA(Ile)-lysidine synthetase [Phytophthora cinnamomi]|uniref:tRNA(Ile)-lysidine synthetase n=1 Tax=Phytophthora cinnamomi TaxID=4785 RepID=UPI00355A060C|nr:tRNA(Ile)-lysidine synthetase [Phytophthora cinnamomi]